MQSFKTSLICCLLAISLSPCTTQATSLFGDDSCAHWQEFSYAQKRTWANAFLAPLSLTLKGLQKTQEDKYNDDPQARETAISAIDSFCLSHPDLGASHGAAEYLKQLYGLTSH